MPQSNRCMMIRDTRAFVAVQMIGALASLYLLINWSVNPQLHTLFPAWFLIGLAAFMFASFVYQIVMRLTGRQVPLAPWARNMSDRQLWIMKAILLIAAVVIAVVFIFVPIHRP